MNPSIASREDSAAADQALALLVEQLAGRLQKGEHVELSAVQREYPEHAQQLARLWPGLRAMADLSQSLRPRSAGGLAGAHGSGDAANADTVTGTLGDFRILREVGRGGMGIVYEGEQISLSRRVALKVLPFAGTMDPKRLQRFKNEARAAAGLHHTNIVPVYGVGSDRGVDYYAMQFIDGQSLEAILRDLRRAEKPGKDSTPADRPSDRATLEQPARAVREEAVAGSERSEGPADAAGARPSPPCSDPATASGAATTPAAETLKEPLAKASTLPSFG